ncbi:MAG: rod shape-determining protein MreC [Saprospirales bacterium]|nr:rod shape-determining protein MreC [Saprospirales bacterium]
MRNLLYLFLQLGGFLLFISLEILSFYLIVQHNQEQRLIFNNSWTNFSAGLDRKIDGGYRYIWLGRKNDSLAIANARLYEELLIYKSRVEELERDSLFLADPDSLSTDTIYRLIPARVVRNSVSEHHNYLLLDKGTKDGVEANMGVVLENGIVGIVRSTGPRHALVMSLLHPQSHPSASIKGTNYFGSLRWEPKNTRELLLENVPKHANPVKGDTIETSGYSLIFPKGIPLGTIKAVDNSDAVADTYKITVSLFRDLANLDRVYIVNKSTQKEQETLLQEVKNE